VADRTVTVNLVGRAQSLGAAFEAGKKGARDFKGELDDLGSKSPKKLNDIAMATGVAGAALLGLAGYAGKASMDFDKQMSEVSAVSNATGKDLTGLRSLAPSRRARTPSSRPPRQPRPRRSCRRPASPPPTSWAAPCPGR
jgi:hypothetical protein